MVTFDCSFVPVQSLHTRARNCTNCVDIANMAHFTLRFDQIHSTCRTFAAKRFGEHSEWCRNTNQNTLHQNRCFFYEFRRENQGSIFRQFTKQTTCTEKDVGWFLTSFFSFHSLFRPNEMPKLITRTDNVKFYGARRSDANGCIWWSTRQSK